MFIAFYSLGMTIIAVDNCIPRLTQLYTLLGEIYPDDEITAFVDPFFAVQYSMNHRVDIAFVQKNLRPIPYINESVLLRKFNKNAKVYLIVDGLDCGTETIEDSFAGYLENPVSREKIENLRSFYDG